MLSILNQQNFLIHTLIIGLLGYFIGDLLHIITVYFLKKIAAADQSSFRHKFLLQLMTGTLFFFTALRFHHDWIMVIYLILICGLIILSAIDITCYLLPDCLTFSLLWLGLLVSTYHLSIPIEAAILGCIIGYLLLRFIAVLFKWLRGMDGIGRGDCKLLAVLGAWCGIEALPIVLLIASLSGLFIGLLLHIYKKRHYTTPVPFGPFLSFGGIVALLVY